MLLVIAVGNVRVVVVGVDGDLAVIISILGSLLGFRRGEEG